MSLEVATFSKLLAASNTLERTFSCVTADVDFQSARAHKLLIAVLTVERSVSSMPAHVVSQMTLSRKRAPTFFKSAFIRLLSTMDSHMCL